MTEYFMLNRSMQAVSLGSEFLRWVHWHREMRHLAVIGNQARGDGSRLLTWFAGYDAVLWESLLILPSGKLVRYAQSATWEDAILAHMRLTYRAFFLAQESSASASVSVRVRDA